MKAQDIIDELIGKNGMKYSEFSRRLEISPQTLNGRLRREGLHVGSVVEMANALNYRLVLVPDTAKLPAGSYEVTLE